MIKRLAKIIGILLVVILMGLGFYTYTPDKTSLDVAQIEADAKAYDARVIRDKFGVPHIYGKRDSDVAFGLGYAHAEDDFETIQLVLALSRGKLAEYKGVDAARTDYLVDLFRVWDDLDARFEADLSPEVRAVLDGYVAGLNLYAVEHEDERWANLFPVNAKDVVGGFVFRAPFFHNLDRDLAELFAEKRQRHISLSSTQTAFQWSDQPDVPRGSNAVAVAPHRSADNKTRLLVNSHQPLTGPVAWYEVRLKSEEGWDVLGALFPGAPVMLHGHNMKLGWAHTVNRPDLVDIYVLERDPENPMRYRYDGGWKDFERSYSTFRVKLFGPFSWPVKREVLWSVHGPVLESSHGTYAFRHPGLGEIRQVEQWYRMNKATDQKSWLEAMSLNAISSLNTIYADADGKIAYIYNARMPKRDERFDWSAYLPGEDPRTLWQGYEPFSKVPKLINPPSGLVFNANHTPLAATGGDDELRLEDFPKSYGIETHYTNRGLRELALWGSDPSISAEEFEAYKFDVTYDGESRVVKFLEPLLVMDFSQEPQLEAAQTLLKSWDRTASQDSKGAALALLTAYRSHWEIRNPGEAAPDALEAFRSAVDQLLTHYGRLDVPWGEVNRIIRGKTNVAVDGGPDTLRAIYAGDELDENGQLNAQGGDSYIQIVEWDENGQVHSRTIHNYGSATLDETSPHFDDQVQLFADERWKEVPLSLEDVLKEATRDYRPGRGE
ncbi:MAG: acylase [Sphingomonadales bacterium]|jgi:penicillin amidase/acyl-homoserine-lactone acylase